MKRGRRIGTQPFHHAKLDIIDWHIDASSGMESVMHIEPEASHHLASIRQLQLSGFPSAAEAIEQGHTSGQRGARKPNGSRCRVSALRDVSEGAFPLCTRWRWARERVRLPFSAILRCIGSPSITA